MQYNMENDTIAAIATALSPSGISIVRISGPEAESAGFSSIQPPPLKSNRLRVYYHPPKALSILPAAGDGEDWC